MISWIQRTFQQHFRVIFALLLAITVISFIFTIGATPGVGRADRRAVDRQFFGHNLGSQEEVQRLLEDARISAELQFGSSGLEAEQIQRYAFERTAALHLADQLHLPPPSQTDVANHIKGMRAFADEKGVFDASRYSAFRTSLGSGQGTTETDMARVISDDVRVETVQRLLAGPGYVLPGDVVDQLERGDTRWTIDTATVDYASFKPDVKPTEAQLTKYFADNSFRYEIAPRVQVEAVEFPATAYVADVHVTDAEVKAAYDENPARFPKPAAAPAPAKDPGAKDSAVKAPAAKSDPAADFAAVRQSVGAAVTLDKARTLAAKAASDFAYALYDGKVAQGSFADVLAKRHLAARPLAPFTNEAGPAEYAGSRDVTDAAFHLTPDRYYSEGVLIPSGAAILILKSNLPARQPALAEVRAKVTDDFVESERRKRFVELGRTLKTALETRLRTGEPFDKAVATAATANNLHITAKTWPPFALIDRPKDLDETALGALVRLNKGEVSDMAITADNGFIVYAAAKEIPSLSPTNPKFAETRAQLAAYSARLGSSAVLGELVDSELKRTEPSVK